MPDPRQRLDDGVRRARAGLLDAALVRYRQAAEETNDLALAAEARRHQAEAHRHRCEWDDAIAAARLSAELAERAERGDLVADALNQEAAVHMSRGEWDDARPLLRRMLELTDDPRVHGIALQNLGNVAAQNGELDTAQKDFQRSFECFRAAGYRRGEATALTNVGRVTLDRGEVVAAAEILRQAVDLARAVEDGDLLALAMTNLGEALMREGNLTEAEEMASSALGFYSMSGNIWRRIETLKLLGDVYVRRVDVETAVACYRQGLQLARSIGARLEVEALERRIAEFMGAGA